MVIHAIEALFSELGIPSRLRDVGVPREALSEIATGAIGDWFLRGSPRPVRSISELEQVLDEAW
jgi:alcohol dehydrogenase class IV